MAYREAERRRDGQAMARAALGLGGLWVHEYRTAADAAMVRMRQRAALPAVDPRSALALRLRTRLAAQEYPAAGGRDAILALVAEARLAGDPAALVEVLSLAHECLLGPDHGVLRLELAQELIGEASKTNRRGDLLMGLVCYCVDLFLSAAPHAERCLAELRGHLNEADHLAVGYVVNAIEVMLTIRAGRFEQAEALAKACADRGTAAGHAAATGWHAAQLGAIRWFQGRIVELLPKLSELVNSPKLIEADIAASAGLAVAAATAGERRLAESILARLRGWVLADRPRSMGWLMSMCCVVEVADALGDAQTAAQAYAILRPYARQPAILSFGIVCFGSVQRHLGLACLTTGDIDKAVDHLRVAVHDNLALGHWPAVALSRAQLGEALTLRDGPRDEAARRELVLAAEEAAALGMPLPANSKRRSGRRTGTTGNVGKRPLVTVCRRRGRQWQVELAGRTVLVEHSVGMRHLATLLANPGYEIHAAALAAGPRFTEPAAANGVATSTQPVLDDQAKRTYKQRLAQLRAEIDQLESANELERAAAVRVEHDWLVAELTAAAGMGGRPRQFTGSEERARIAVGKAIKRAINRIAEADPVIGEALRATVHTGLRCCYRPE